MKKSELFIYSQEIDEWAYELGLKPGEMEVPIERVVQVLAKINPHDGYVEAIRKAAWLLYPIWMDWNKNTNGKYLLNENLIGAQKLWKTDRKFRAFVRKEVRG